MTIRSMVSYTQSISKFNGPGITTMKLECAKVLIRSVTVLALVILVSFNLTAQFTQPAIYERSHKESDRTFLVVSMGDKGIALIRDTEKFEGNKKNWEIIFVKSA